MNKFLKIFFLVAISIFAFSCNDDEQSPTIVSEVLRDFQIQENADNLKIVNFLKNNYVEVINNLGSENDQDVTVKQILYTDTGKTSIYDMPNLKFIDVLANDITYKVYYLELRKGSGAQPCNVDNVFMGFSGQVINELATVGDVFDSSTNTETKYALFGQGSVIKGWSAILPQFRTGTITKAPDGSSVYNDFGAGIMFIPSGLAYYNFSPSSNIPTYSPLMFKFKMFKLERTDQDNDGIFSYLEDYKTKDGSPGTDGYFYNSLNSSTGTFTSNDDTDSDGIPDFIDIDDDNDFLTTKLETSVSGTLSGPFFPFNNVIDDPATTFDETQSGIPDCSGNGTNPARLRRHLIKCN